MTQKYLLLLIVCKFCTSSLFSQEIKYKFKSDFQEDSTTIHIVKTIINTDSTLNLIFVLPVEEFKENYEYGNGIEECNKIARNNSKLKNTIFIQPDYNRIPWYGNHPSNDKIRQLDHTIEVIKKIKSKYSKSEKNINVFLLGFSKSGWGCMNILTKHPTFIDGILIWDSPLATKWKPEWSMEEIFGNEENFMKNYYLMRENGINYEKLKNKKIIVGGYDYFESQSIEFLHLLDENGVNYVHDDTISYTHRWNKEWIYKLLLNCNSIAQDKLLDLVGQ